MSKEVADKFVEALRSLEDNRDLETIVGLYAEDCEVGNVVAPEKFHGTEGARKFWTTYRDTFGAVKSEFRNVFATDERAALEWVTDGTSTNGEAIHYEGVTLLEIDGDRVTRSRAYFDAGGLGRQIVKDTAHTNDDASRSK